jgi:uncharacterized membrane protein YccC
MPDIKFPEIDIQKAAADLNKALKDGAYVAVGLGVLGFQRAQVQRVELAKQLDAYFTGFNKLPSSLNTQLTEIAKSVEEALAPAREQFTKALPEITKALPDVAKAIDERVAPARQQLDEQFDRIEEALPAAARDIVKSVRSAAVSQEQAFRTAVGLD